MRKALYFEDALEFCDFVRLCGPDTKSSADGNPFELCRALHPARPGESALVLFNCKPALKRGLRRIVTPIDAEVDLGEQTLFWNLENSPSSPLTGRTRGDSLLGFIELHPWKQIGARQPAGPVVFWISGTEAERADLLARLIRDSLRLGNDRIQFGQIEAEKSKATLLRIESPSFFLIQACQEDHAGSVEMFYPTAGDRFVRWGFTHPLESWWDQSQPPETSEKWLFLRGGADYLHVDPVAWQDAYELAEISLDFPHHEVWAASPGLPPRFEVPLTLERKLASTEPELWLLDEAGVHQLENTLQITDEESLRAWQIAVQRSEDDSSERDWIFIRETHAGQKRRHHDFIGVGFARYRGLNNLYLPVGCELQPPLRRDAYRGLFQLQSDTITVVVPADDGFNILRVKEKAFDALSSLVDYIVQRDADALKNLISESVFDFGHYLKAPKHPGLFPETSDAESRKGRVSGSPSDLAASSNQSGGDNEDPESNALADRLKAPDVAIDESQLGELQREELRLEREIIASGQSIERWSALLKLKNQLGKNSDAILCAIEALWLAHEPQEREWLQETLKNLAASEFESAEEPAAVDRDEPEWQQRAATFALAAQRPDAPGQIDRWIGEMTAFLQAGGESLRAKDRWLAWGAVLSANRDFRRETQLREEIRNRITERGLSLEETPAFIRSRIFLDRTESDAGEDSGTNAATARSNLEGIRDSGLAFESQRLRRAHRAVLARACSEIGDIGPAGEMAEVRKIETDASLSAWEMGFLVIAFQKIDPAQAHSLEGEYEQRLDQADPDTTRAIRELREFYDAKARADSPAAFLVRENRGRTYPRGAGTESGRLYELSMDLENYSLAGNELGAVQTMRAMMNLGETSEYDDSVKLPQFIETLVAGLERFKWGERGAGLVPIFESFSDRAPGFLSTRESDFYGAILHSNLALGLLTIENLEKALGQLRLATEAVTRNTLELDFIDSAAAVVRTVEQLPLGHRAPFLDQLMESFGKLFDVENSPYVANERLFAVLVKFLNQMAEASSSKDRLSLEQFRHYQLQDEFLILQRIQSESFCGNDD